MTSARDPDPCDDLAILTTHPANLNILDEDEPDENQLQSRNDEDERDQNQLQFRNDDGEYEYVYEGSDVVEDEEVDEVEDVNNPAHPLVLNAPDFVTIIRQGLRVWKASGSLLAVIVNRGKTPLTRDHFELMLRLLRPFKSAPGGSRVPAFSTLTRTIYPFIYKHCLPAVRYIESPHDPIDEPKNRANSIFIYPSAWALYDTRCYSFFRCLQDPSRRDYPFSFNQSPYATMRNSAFGEENTLHIPFKSCPQRIGPGDIIDVTLDKPPEPGTPNITLSQGAHTFSGKVLRIFTNVSDGATPFLPFLRPGDLSAVSARSVRLPNPAPGT